MSLLRTTLLCCAALLHGCTVMKPTTLPESFWKETGKSIAVSVQRLPKPVASKFGNFGLLGVAANQMVFSGWDAHMKGMTFEPYEALTDEVVKQLGDRGFTARPVTLNLAALPKYATKPEQKKKAVLDKDLSSAGDLAGVDYLVLVTPTLIGTARSYNGLIPMEDPSGYFAGHAAVVDVRTNEIKWWKDIGITRIANIPWDQPPSYPNLSKAIVQAVDESKQLILKELFSGAPVAAAAQPTPAASAGL